MKQLKSLTHSHIPSGDQLTALCIKNDYIWTLKEWVEYAYETPEIELEKERQWPDEPELIY